MVRRQPDHLAVSFNGTHWSYSELNRQANVIAHGLCRRGFATGLPIAIGLGPGPRQIAAMLGVLKAGGFFVFLDTRNPLERNRLILEQSCNPLIITDSAARSWLDTVVDASAGRLDLDSLDISGSTENPGFDIQPGALACLIFTSGSTGRPKGVMHDHETLLHNADRHINEYGLGPLDRQLLLYSLAVYGGQRDVLNALMSGASLHIYPLLSRGLNELPRWVRDERVTIYCSVVTVFRQMLRLLDHGASLPDVRLFKLGGEASYSADIESFRQRLLPGARVHCGLGCSEAGLLRSFFIDHDTELPGGPLPLGYELGDMDVRLIGPDGKAADSGEITVFSRYVMQGYWQEPELTARVLGVDPDDPSRRIFRTGDLAMRDARGCFWMQGRADNQVKVNGNRVQLDEVEAAVKRLPGIQDGVVVARHDVQHGDALEACLATIPGERQPSSAEVRKLLAAELPSFMVPTIYRWLDALPQLPNGKIDRKQLASLPPLAVSTGEKTPRSAANRTEREVIRIWGHVLGRTDINVEDDFFDLGGESLRGMMVIATVARELGITLPLVELLKSRTVEAFAAALDRSGQERRFNALVPFRTEGQRLPLFCVHGVYGGVLFLKELADLLPTDQPLYALQPPNLDGTRFSFDSIEELAAHYIETIKTVQPEGPYLIGGFSFGGKVAFEMARQLVALGNPVRKLVIFDSGPPRLDRNDVAPSSSIDPDVIGHSLRSHLRKVRQGGDGIAESISSVAGLLADSLRPALHHFFLRFNEPLSVEHRDVYLSWNHRRLLRTYYAETLSCDVTVFGSVGRLPRLQSDWPGSTSGCVTVIPVAGDHRGIFTKPGVDVLAAELLRLFDEGIRVGP